MIYTIAIVLIILWLLGLDHVSLTYLHNGRAERPTITDGELIKELFA